MSRIVVIIPLVLALLHAPSLAAQPTAPILASRFEVPPPDSRADVAHWPSADAAVRPVRRDRFVAVGGAVGSVVGVVWLLRRTKVDGLGIFALPVGLWVSAAGGALAGGTLGYAVSYVVHPPRRRTSQ